MARIDISEFQFSFAFFHKFMSLEKNIEKSFAVPSLRQEGGTGTLGGLDLKVGDDYFFQFKMPDRLISNGAKEIRLNKLENSFSPYFRFKVKNSNKSNQFNTLVELAKKVGKDKVFYISPLFDYPIESTADEEAFYNFWNSNPVEAISKTCWIDFYQFNISNPLVNEKNDNHVICYNNNSVTEKYAFLLSEPQKIKVLNEFKSNIKSEPISLISKITEIAKILDAIESQQDIRSWKISDILDEINDKNLYQVLNLLQIEIIAKFNIFWIPQIIK